ncbi:MAG: single-stranded-DNA-specific exonuclease RecJ [Blautia sp.]|nr:single-stranded-DNA-specific exonuclease RecJ [Blautia sp.]
MEKWVVASKKADFKQIGIRFGIDQVIARLIHNRDIVGDENIQRYLYGKLEDLASPHLLMDMDLVVGILSEKISQKKRIRIIGDYDIDGVMSVYILMKSLRDFGADVDYRIPERIADGYGLNLRLILEAHQEGIDTILTCDNGISAVAEIEKAKELGLTVIVTDHHEVPFENIDNGKRQILPPADAVIDPMRSDCTYPQKNICGAVVAWKLVTALEERIRGTTDEAMRFLEFAAFATVGDVMDLVGENRVIVREGLPALENTENVGMQALLRATNMMGRQLGAYQIGFVLGPCVNASGRLDTAMKAIGLLLETDPEKADEIAQELCRLNDARKDMTEKGREDALAAVIEKGYQFDRVLVIFLPDCHESLAGIIAGRVREEYHRPCFIITRSEGCCKGSGRSIEEYSMFEELSACKDILEKFGGHPMAAGLSIREDRIDELRRRLNENCSLTHEDLIEKIHIDAAMPIAYLSKRLVNQMQLLEPFGKGNERPLFAQKDLHTVDARVVGKNKNALKLRLVDANGVSLSAIYFGDAQKMYEELHIKNRLAVTYVPEINVYQGRESLQIVIQNYKVY